MLEVPPKTVKLAKEEVNQVRVWAEQWFWFFCQMMMPDEWYDEQFHFDLCNFLQYGPNDKLVVLPRSFLKTTVVSQFFPLWRSLKDTNRRTLITGNSFDNAAKTVHTIRGFVESSQMLQLLWPEVIPRFDKVRWSDKCADLNRRGNFPEGTFEAAGIGSNIVRRHFNTIIQDDTVSPRKDALTGQEAMPSRDDIEKAVGFHKLTIPLLVTFQEDERVVVGTRWASYDLINYIYENETQEKGGRFGVFDKPALHPETGKPLYKRYSLEALDQIRVGMGTYMFSSLYLNSPLSKDAMKFNPDWFKYYEEFEIPEGKSVVTVDPADPPTGKKDQCYSAVVGCRHTKRGIYVRKYSKKRCTDKETIGDAIDMAVEIGANKIRLETDRYANMQYGFQDEIKRRRAEKGGDPRLYISVDPVKTKGRNKDGRIMGLQPIVESGCLYLKRGMRQLEQELVHYPNGEFLDLIDALSWQLPDHRTDFMPPEEEEKEMVDKYRTFSQETILDSIRRGPGRGRISNYIPKSRMRDHMGL